MPKEELKRIDIGDLTEAVTLAVQRAIASRKAIDPINPFHNPRIICGLIIEPHGPYEIPTNKPD